MKQYRFRKKKNSRIVSTVWPEEKETNVDNALFRYICFSSTEEKTRMFDDFFQKIFMRFNTDKILSFGL